MKLVNCFVAAVLVGAVVLVRPDEYLSGALLIAALLSVLTLYPVDRVSLMTSIALLNMVLMFYFFYRFFSLVPGFELHWFMNPAYAEAWLSLLGGFSAMHILADNSCCLKREFEASSEAAASRVLLTLRNREQKSQTAT